MASDRLPCCVPFCRCTVSVDRGFKEWVCAKHWRMVPMSVKQPWHTARRRMRKILRGRPDYATYWKMPPGSPERLNAVRLWGRIDSAWEKCKAAAIEAAAGIR